MKKFYAIALVCVLGLAVGNAHGLVQTYTSYAAWKADAEAVAGVPSTETNWEAMPLGTPLNGLEGLPTLTYAPPGGDDGSMLVDDLIATPPVTLEGMTYTRGLGRIGGNDSISVFGLFSGIGAFIIESDHRIPGPESVDYYGTEYRTTNNLNGLTALNGGPELLATQEFPIGDSEPGNSQKIHFVGVVGLGGELFGRMDLVESHEDGHLDNVMYGAFVTTPPVPEPATMALLGLGTVGLAALRRRRRK